MRYKIVAYDEADIQIREMIFEGDFQSAQREATNFADQLNADSARVVDAKTNEFKYKVGPRF